MTDTIVSLKAVSEEIRVRLLTLLADHEACVCELTEVFGMSQSRISHHLITLRGAGFLKDRRRGKWNFYRAIIRSSNGMNKELLNMLVSRYRDNPKARKDKKAFEEVKKRLRINC